MTGNNYEALRKSDYYHWGYWIQYWSILYFSYIMRVTDWIFTIFATLFVAVFFAGLSALLVWDELALEDNYPIYWVAALALIAYLWDTIDDLIKRHGSNN